MRRFVLLMLLVASVASAATHPGLRNLMSKAYSPSVIDAHLFDNLWRSWEAPAREAARQAAPAQRRAMTLDRYGLLEAPYPNGGAPLGFVVKDDGTWAMTCLICHAGSVEGRTVLGLPNNALDFSSIYEDIGQTVTMLHGDEPGAPDFPQGLLTFASPENPGTVHFPEGLLSVSRGTVNSFTFSVYFLSLRDQDLNLRDAPLDLPRLNHYLDAPPLWHTAKRASFYSDAFAEKTVRPLMQFSLDPSFGPEVFKAWEADYVEIFDWLHTLEAPRYSGPVDAAAASAGAGIYSEHCSKCHGIPGPEGDYENKVVPVGKVRTDRARLDGLAPEFRRHLGESWLGAYGETRIDTAPEGYTPPPLDGIWATAPYFHNGSVPTLFHVLFPAERPVVWRVTDYAAYDHRRMGLTIEEYDRLPATQGRSDARAFYDTNRFSMSAGGHPFADELDRSQRLDLLEYLKTL